MATDNQKSRHVSMSYVDRYGVDGRTIEHVTMVWSRSGGVPRTEHVHLCVNNGKRQQSYLISINQLRGLFSLLDADELPER